MKNHFFKLAICLSVIAFTSCSDDDSNPQGPIEIIIDGAAVAPEVGGPNQPNQVYVDLSTNTTTAIRRDTWDLGFYSGTDFRVTINGSLYMAVAELSTTDIDAISSSTMVVQDLQPQVAVGTFEDASKNFIDAPDGSISATAISEISANAANNKVYLLNLGKEIGTTTPSTGSEAVAGDPRGWKKIRILRNGDDYILQYADLDASTHNEITIQKNPNYNFTFFSFETETTVTVEPERTLWDLNFSVFTNEIEGYGAYGYADFVINNLKADSKAYLIDTEVFDFTYDDFMLADVDDSKFLNDQRGIGSTWRNGGGPSALPTLKETVFYVVHDANGHFYKLKFLALTNPDGVRGYPEFVYSLLQ